MVKNYTGDVINFRIAAERLAADGIAVRTVLVDDDLATDNDDTGTGRRGTGATVVVEKILGAAADAGLALEDLETLGLAVASASRSLAVADRAQTSPATGEPGFVLNADELEYGVGIHGERGIDTISRPATNDLLQRMVDTLLTSIGPADQGVIVFVNGLGSVTDLELRNVHHRVSELLVDRGVTVASSLVGTYVAALDMRGFSLTLTAVRDDWLDHWLAPSQTPAFPRLQRTTVPDAAPSGEQGSDTTEGTEPATATADPLVSALLDAAIRYHDRLTALDQATGDGDFGDNLVGGLRRAASLAGSTGLGHVAEAFLNDVGGTSGPLLGLLFQHLDTATGGELSDEAIRTGLSDGCEAIVRVGGAQPGDRTMVDALSPAAAEFDAVSAAKAGIAAATTTADMTARLGRASYVGDRALGHADPGAAGTALLIATLASVLHPDSAAELQRALGSLF